MSLRTWFTTCSCCWPIRESSWKKSKPSSLVVLANPGWTKKPRGRSSWRSSRKHSHKDTKAQSHEGHEDSFQIMQDSVSCGRSLILRALCVFAVNSLRILSD